MKRLALWRTTAVRIAVAYTAAFGLLMAVGLGSVYQGTIGVIERQTDATITAEIRGLAERFSDGGLPDLVAAVEARSGQDAPTDNVYLLVAPTLKRLAGNLSAWPEVAVPDEWVAFPVTKRDGERVAQRKVRARAFVLPGGFRLLVGRDSEDQERFRLLFFEAALWVAAGTLVFGLVTGLLLGRRVLRRVDQTAAAGERIAAGNLDSRVPVTGRGDEFDRLAEAVNAMLDRIEGLLAGMRMATDSISHDVRRPLTRLRAKLDLVLRRQAGEGTGDPQAQADMAEAIGEIDATVQILENLLRIARAEAGVPAETWVELDLAALAGAALDLYQPLAEERGIAVELALAPAAVRGEPQLLAQALANLIDNALKYAPPGTGRVRVETDTGAQGAVFAVTDNGPGIPAEAVDRVTERFVRLDVARESEGSGLGLSLVRAVARMHGGTLELADAGPGLAARIVLPAA